MNEWMRDRLLAAASAALGAVGTVAYVTAGVAERAALRCWQAREDTPDLGAILDEAAAALADAPWQPGLRVASAPRRDWPIAGADWSDYRGPPYDQDQAG